ncbi:MAG: hypothetical protein HZA80_00270 [Candidatus Taylorbacteria bacterium]|nr:hypothetical protein [Candidatus Taylorbacteria bacterium]
MNPYHSRTWIPVLVIGVVVLAALSGYTLSQKYHGSTVQQTEDNSRISEFDGEVTILEVSEINPPILSLPPSHVFGSTPRASNISNVVGYIAGGAFTLSIPEWIVQNWMMTDSEDGNTIVVTPRTPTSDTKDFSDIVIYTQATDENFNAQWLYESELKSGMTILNSEVILNEETGMRIYHIEKQNLGNDIHALFFLDGTGKTAKITFSAEKGNYTYYSSKVKEFVKSLMGGVEKKG